MPDGVKRVAEWIISTRKCPQKVYEKYNLEFDFCSCKIACKSIIFTRGEKLTKVNWMLEARWYHLARLVL